MDIKAVFFDIDGTFYDHITDRVLRESLAAIQLLQQNGYKVCLCSGRAKEMAEQLGVLQMFPWDGYIGGAGVHVYNREMHLIYENIFSYEQTRHIFEIGKMYDICIHSHGYHEFMTKPLNPYAKVVFDEFHCKTPNVDIWHGESLTAISAYEKIGFDWSMFHDIKGIQLYTNKTCTDFMKTDTNKANGIHKLMEYWGFHPQAYIAFGDSLNDMEMIQDAHIGFAMENADHKLKVYANRVIGASNTPTIYHTLKMLGFI